MDWRTIVRRDEHVVARAVAGETLLVPVEGELANMQQVFVLEGVGEFIWELLDREQTLAEVRDAVIDQFEVGVDEASTDCLEFVTELAKAKLIRVRANE